MVRRKDDCEAGRRRNASARNVSLDDSSSQNGDNGKLSKNNSKMRKRKKKDFEKNICAAEVCYSFQLYLCSILLFNL